MGRACFASDAKAGKKTAATPSTRPPGLVVCKALFEGLEEGEIQEVILPRIEELPQAAWELRALTHFSAKSRPVLGLREQGHRLAHGATGPLL